MEFPNVSKHIVSKLGLERFVALYKSFSHKGFAIIHGYVGTVFPKFRGLKFVGNSFLDVFFHGEQVIVGVTVRHDRDSCDPVGELRRVVS